MVNGEQGRTEVGGQRTDDGKQEVRGQRMVNSKYGSLVGCGRGTLNNDLKSIANDRVDTNHFSFIFTLWIRHIFKWISMNCRYDLI